MGADRTADHDPLLNRVTELEALESEYEYAREFIRTKTYHQEQERLRARIERTVLSASGSSDANFTLGQCYALVRELHRYEDAIKLYESKKKSLDEMKRIVAHRQ